MPGTRIQFDQETWNALDLLATDRMQDFQKLADEAFGELLRKHGRPVDLKTALRQSVGGDREVPAGAVRSARAVSRRTIAKAERLLVPRHSDFDVLNQRSD